MRIKCKIGDSSSNPLQVIARKSKFPKILRQNGQIDLEDEGLLPPFSIPAESIPGYMLGANVVIPAQICDQ